MNPETVFHELRERYAGLRSYQDEGLLLSQLPGSDFVNETKFSTFFRRPNRFRFDWTSHHPYPPLKHITTDHCIWQSASGVYSWWQGRGTESATDLHLAISGAKGVSGGSSYTVPALLLASEPVFVSERLTVQAVAVGETEGIDCHCVIAFDARKRPYRLYIGREDMLLHRVSSSVRDGSTSDEIRRSIRTDHAIDESVFTIEPA
jgi:outer membrane lipoprotein-sorting protein